MRSPYTIAIIDHTGKKPLSDIFFIPTFDSYAKMMGIQLHFTDTTDLSSVPIKIGLGILEEKDGPMLLVKYKDSLEYEDTYFQLLSSRDKTALLIKKKFLLKPKVVVDGEEYVIGPNLIY